MAPVIVQADAGRLRQVLDNLIGNALQHTTAGTPVTVTVTAAGGQGQASVTDTGPGLSAAQASQVFDRFYRTDRARSRASGGTGLGLSIAATLVAAHGGTIDVDTQPGRGATFTVRLPLAAAPADGGPPEPHGDDAEPAGDLPEPAGQQAAARRLTPSQANVQRARRKPAPWHKETGRQPQRAGQPGAMCWYTAGLTDRAIAY